MASIYNRGSRENPNLWAKLRHLDGKWKGEPVPEPHNVTKVKARRWAEKRQEEIDAGKPDPRHAPTCGDLFPLWLASLTNRNAKSDTYAVNKHLVPAFRDRRPSEIENVDLVRWLDEMKGADKPLSGSTQRTCMGLLSRFYGWAIARGHAKYNPVMMIPRGERPRQKPKDASAPWVKDDSIALAIAAALPSPWGIMYLVGYRCGMRPGEVAGLRLSDLGELSDGVIRCRYSEDGPLKEDDGDGPAPKVKWPAAPADIRTLLGSWLAQREAEGAEQEDFLFRAPKVKGKPDHGYYTAMQRSRAWRSLPEEMRAGMTFYVGSRHSFTSRNLEAGVPLEEVSSQLGHSTPAVTKRYYDRHVRKTHATIAARPLQLEDAKVLAFPAGGTALGTAGGARGEK